VSEPDPSADRAQPGAAHSDERGGGESVDNERRKMSFYTVRRSGEEQNHAQSGLYMYNTASC